MVEQFNFDSTIKDVDTRTWLIFQANSGGSYKLKCA